jgi:hypothetical protein
MLALLFLSLALAFVVALPILLVSVVLRVALGLVLLPFKLLGGIFKLGFGLAGGLFRLAFGAVCLLAVVVGSVFCVVLLPLLPFLIVGAMFWAFLRLVSGPSRSGRAHLVA